MVLNQSSKFGIWKKRLNLCIIHNIPIIYSNLNNNNDFVFLWQLLVSMSAKSWQWYTNLNYAKYIRLGRTLFKSSIEQCQHLQWRQFWTHVFHYLLIHILIKRSILMPFTRRLCCFLEINALHTILLVQKCISSSN